MSFLIYNRSSGERAASYKTASRCQRAVFHPERSVEKKKRKAGKREKREQRTHAQQVAFRAG